MKKILDMLKGKVEVAKEDSDFTYFFNLLVAGEALTKIITLIAAASLNQNKDRHQYRILYGLVRSSGVGEWSKAIDDLLVGTASQHLDVGFRPYQAELLKKANESEWQYKAVSKIIEAMNELQIKTEIFPGNKDLKQWFKYFSELRNKTRGHGALNTERAARAAVFLSESISLITDNLSLLGLPTAYLRRNLSGKYRVTEICNVGEIFDDLKNQDFHQFEDGVYVFVGSIRKVPLIVSDAELLDFYIANGGFTNTKYELLSYVSDDKKVGDSGEFLAPVGQLPSSESDGLGELVAIGNCFSNVPDLSYEYIQREELEDSLFSLLSDERRTVVTLLGRGGIGKTSLALRVIPRLYDVARFDAVIWFSSRDIDLQTGGAKLVTADVTTSKDIAKYYCSLVVSQDMAKSKGFNAVEYFQSQLTNSCVGPCLFVFDNFETTDSPVEIFKWIDTYVRNPNKILITTRLRDFVGDYPLNVHGMTLSESLELIKITARRLSVEDKLTDELMSDIYKVSAGHPYIIKIMLGELSKTGMKGALPKIIAGSEEVLTALFERTYAALNPCAQRVFLTLASWNSAMPRLALEAVLMVSIEEPLEVERAVDTLLQYSMAEEVKANLDGQYFIGLPYVARAFGYKKLGVSPLRSMVVSDVRILQLFGAETMEHGNLSLSRCFSRFLSALPQTEKEFEAHKDIIERICWSFVDGWLLAARWLVESNINGLLLEAKKYLLLYLENQKNDKKKAEAWKQLADIYRVLHEPLEEIHSLIELTQYSHVDFSELSNAANKVNHMLSTQELVLVNYSVKNELLSKLFTVVWRRKAEGDAADCSRMAWLALHLDKADEAKKLVELGLSKDPDNRYCQKLADKFAK